MTRVEKNLLNAPSSGLSATFFPHFGDKGQNIATSKPSARFGLQTGALSRLNFRVRRTSSPSTKVSADGLEVRRTNTIQPQL